MSSYVLNSFSIFLVSNLIDVLQNYDFPNNCEDYIHRIGRTGVSSLGGLPALPLISGWHFFVCVFDHWLQRAGQKGTSYTFFTTENAKAARELITILKEAKANIPPELQEMVQYGGGGGGDYDYDGPGCVFTFKLFVVARMC